MAIMQPSPWVTAAQVNATEGFNIINDVTATEMFTIPQGVHQFDTMDQFLDNQALMSAIHKSMRRQKPKTEPEKTTKLLQELFPFKAMRLNKTATNNYERGLVLQSQPMQWCTTQGMVGIEVEVENMPNSVPLKAYWEAKADNSLRNSGSEFVSIPLQIKQIQPALEHLYASMYQTNKPDFSNRTSTHVHVNCRDMTQDQIFVFCLLYAIFEKHFYSFAGTKRLNSIFCVPLYRTQQLKSISDVIYHFHPTWNKYCGINLLPLVNNNDGGAYGTIEFRQLYGTNDMRTVMEWINNILCLRKHALLIPKDDIMEMIKSMNTTSSYMSLYTEVFSGCKLLLSNKKDFEDCVSNIKSELFGNMFLNTFRNNISASSNFWNVCNELGIKG